jgi:putative heme degradation protein
MTIDERIEALAKQQEASNQRQIALDESIGELVAIGRRTDERLDRLTARHESLAMTVESLGRDVAAMVSEGRAWREKVGPLVNRIGKIVVDHESRIKYLEGGAV